MPPVVNVGGLFSGRVSPSCRRPEHLIRDERGGLQKKSLGETRILSFVLIAVLFDLRSCIRDPFAHGVLVQRSCGRGESVETECLQEMGDGSVALSLFGTVLVDMSG